MNQPEFDKQLIADLIKLTKLGWYMYSMALFNAYPCRWKAVLAMHDLSNKQYPECEDLEIEVCCN